MALPTLVKTWQHDVNRQVGSLSALPACNQSAMCALKESLRGFGSAAWGVWGSCDGTAFGNGDGVDRWRTAGVGDPSKLVWGTGSHSWIVLTQPGLSTKAAICIDLSNANSYNCTVVLSPSAGFGTANGGTNGSASLRPTASDQVVLLNNAAWGGYNGTLRWRQHVMMSTDGKCTRILMNRSNASSGLWLFDTVRNPVTGWSVPIVGVAYGVSDTSGVISYANFSTAANTWGKIGADTCSFYMTGEAYGTTGLQTVVTAPDDDLGEWPLFPVGLQSASASHRGRKGEMQDMWWIAGGSTGTTYPSDDTRRLFGHGHFAFPWDGSVPWTWF